MAKTNTAWHASNRMPPRATLEQRIGWHQAHAEHCGCRRMPENIRKAIAARTTKKPPIDIR